MSSVPGGALTGMPSMVRLTAPSAISDPSSRDQHGLPLARDVVLEFAAELLDAGDDGGDRKSTRLNSSHVSISYAVFCLKKKISPEWRQPPSADTPRTSRTASTT